MTDEQVKATNAALKAMDRLVKMFSIERYVYLCLAVASFVLTFYAAYVLISKDTSDDQLKLVGMIFGGSGIMAVATTRVTLFFSKAFGLIEGVIRSPSNDR